MKKILFISFIFSTIACSQTLIPKLPQITASSFLLIDAETNKIIAQQNPEALNRVGKHHKNNDKLHSS